MRLLPALVLPASALLHAGCASTDPDLLLSFYPTEIVSPVINATDEILPKVSMALLNENAVNLDVSLAAVAGNAATVASLEPGVSGKPISLAPGESLNFTFSPGRTLSGTDRRLWRTGEVEGIVRITASIGQTPSGGAANPLTNGRVQRTLDIPVVIPFNCDLDGDGADDPVCGGNDCDDTTAGIGPAAAEVCDGVDNNCNGAVDEGCAPD